MMKKQQATGLRTAARDYVTIVQQACNKVNGFSELCQEMERSINISGKSKSTFINYCRQLAHLALHYERFPLDLDSEPVMDYLHLVRKRGTVSATFFKFTVYGLRYARKMRGLEYKQFRLPEITRDRKLPAVRNGSEVKSFLKCLHRDYLGLSACCPTLSP